MYTGKIYDEMRNIRKALVGITVLGIDLCDLRFKKVDDIYSTKSKGALTGEIVCEGDDYVIIRCGNLVNVYVNNCIAITELMDEEVWTPYYILNGVRVRSLNLGNIDIDENSNSISLRGTQFERAKEIWTMFCKVKSLEVDLSNVDMRSVSIVHDMFYKCDIGVLNLSGIKLPKCLRISGRLFGHVDKLILNDTDLSNLTVICTEFRHCDDEYDNGHQNKDCICNVYMHDCKIKYTLLDKLSDIVTCRTLYTNMEHIYEWCRRSNVKCVYSGGITVDGVFKQE